MVCVILLAAIYLTTNLCICGISIVCQLAVLNCYHVYPLREIPSWLRKMQSCMVCTSGAHNNEVYPHADENGHVHNHFSKNEERTLNMGLVGGKGAESNLSDPGGNIMPSNENMIKNIKRNNSEENLRLEWRALGRHYDCFLFFSFAAIHVCVILIMVGILPFITKI